MSDRDEWVKKAMKTMGPMMDSEDKFIYACRIYDAGLAARAQQGEGRAIGEIDEGEEGVFVELYPDNTFTIGQKVYTHPPKANDCKGGQNCSHCEPGCGCSKAKAQGASEGDVFETLHEAVASMPMGTAEDDNDTPTEHILHAIKPFLSTTAPADKPEGEWVKDIRCHLQEAVRDLYPLDTWQIVKAPREELKRFNDLRNLVVAILDLPAPASPDMGGEK